MTQGRGSTAIGIATDTSSRTRDCGNKTGSLTPPLHGLPVLSQHSESLGRVQAILGEFEGQRQAWESW